MLNTTQTCVESHEDAVFMQMAMRLAQQAQEQGEVPVGAVVVANGKVIGEGYNQLIGEHDPCGHAEIIAIRQAAQHAQNYRIGDASLYVTLEPCAMCAGAMVHARINRVVFGAFDAKTGACGSVFNIVQSEALNHQLEVQGGILEEACAAQISDFFKQRRALKKEQKKANKKLIESDSK